MAYGGYKPAKITATGKGKEMKVTFSKEYKRFLTVEQYERAKEIIREMKDDESTAAEYAQYAVNAIGRACGIGSCDKVFECSAEIAGNCRIHDYFGDGSGTLDIWLSGIAKTWDGFVKFGAYLSDIWSISYDTAEDIAKNHMYYEIFKKA